MARGGLEKRNPVGIWVDKWWPILVVMATALSMILLHGITFTSGVFYVEFLEEFNQGRGETAWVGSLIAACGYAARFRKIQFYGCPKFLTSKDQAKGTAMLLKEIWCPVSSILVNKFGCRLTVVLSGLIMAAGLCTSVFAQNVYLLFFTYGVVTGERSDSRVRSRGISAELVKHLAFTRLLPPTTHTHKSPNQHHLSFAPKTHLFVHKTHFSFRRFARIGCGFIYVPANVIVARYFFKRRTIALGIATGCGGLGSFAFPPLLRYLLDEFGWRGTLLICGGICLNVCVAGAIMRPPSKEDLSNENVKEETDDRKCEKRTDKGRDVLIFKNLSYHFICINNSLFCFASSIVYVHLSAFAIGKLHVTESQATNLISVIGIATFVGRLAFGFLAQHPRLKPIYIYTFTFTVAGLATCLVPFMTNYEQILVYCVVFGLSFAALGGALLPCILIDIAGLDRLSFSYGVLIFYEAVGQILGAPVAGFLYDGFQSYDPSFFLGGFMVLLSAAILLLPIRKTCNNSLVNSDDILSKISLTLEETEEEVVVTQPKVSSV
ncbi:monocarboxylate transporter 9-like [Liolophura sinensis]|uniref:monocarboxylate transporter 9-like n=1 Tax=Liolophura sinensis TaxID=3198878 RepID=UPI0031580154